MSDYYDDWCYDSEADSGSDTGFQYNRNGVDCYDFNTGEKAAELKKAMWENNLEEVKYLVEHGARPDRGVFISYYATKTEWRRDATTNFIAIFKYMLSSGAGNPNDRWSGKLAWAGSLLTLLLRGSNAELLLAALDAGARFPKDAYELQEDVYNTLFRGRVEYLPILFERNLLVRMGIL